MEPGIGPESRAAPYEIPAEWRHRIAVLGMLELYRALDGGEIGEAGAADLRARMAAADPGVNPALSRVAFPDASLDIPAQPTPEP